MFKVLLGITTSGFHSLFSVVVTIYLCGEKMWKETINKNNANFGKSGELVDFVLCI